MTTKTQNSKMAKNASTSVVNTADIANLPKLPKTLDTLQFLRTAKGKADSDAYIHPKLDEAYNECKRNDCVLVLERILIHIGDVSRQHNLLREHRIMSPNGGAQERKIFRSILRWWENKMPKSFKRNLRNFVEFTLYENLMYYQNTTERKTGRHVNTEVLLPNPKLVYDFIASQIRAGADLNLIARHLPKYYSKDDTSRTTKKRIKIRGDVKEIKYRYPQGKAWCKLNGEFVTGDVIIVKAGDIISYPRKKQSFALSRQEKVNSWIDGFCKVMGWTISEYKKFRSLQNTPEQAFSSKKVLSLAKDEFMSMLDRLTSGQRFRVATMVAFKDDKGNLQAKPKWGKLGEYYIEWEKNQEKIADQLREAASTNDEVKKKELMKEFKVKATGVQSIDLLAQIVKGGMSDMQINNTYQSLIEKMDLIANVFPIIDGSGSMDDSIMHNGVKLSNRYIAYALCIAFSTRNPVESFRNTYGWFSKHFDICGRSKFVNDAPNQFVSAKSYTRQVPDHQVISETKTFTENLKALAGSCSREVSSTNMFSSIEYFVQLVKDGKFHVEDLPVALLYITDNENNTGKTPREAQAYANSIGWNPLLIFWGLENNSERTKVQLKGVDNCLYLGGFNEGNLSEILRNIKTGAINPEEELWSIYNNIRYSVIV